MAGLKKLKPVKSRAGQPLYLAVRDTLREAIDSGVFEPGRQLPSTKDLSKQLSVSLVTAHRALQGLVNSGVLRRAQGRGTYVHERYTDRRGTIGDMRFGLSLHAGAALTDIYHGQIMHGIRQAAQEHAIDLVFLRFGEDCRNECDALLLVHPPAAQIDEFVSRTHRPIVIIGSGPQTGRVSSIQVDAADLARQAVEHLANLGHTRIGYVGGEASVSAGEERWRGFLDACEQRGIRVAEQQVLRALRWHLDERESPALMRMLSAADRPTAVFAAGYEFALDVYAAAEALGLRIPEDLSVVGVDNPPSAAHLSPALTTLRQPLAQLGADAVTMLVHRIRGTQPEPANPTLPVEFILRRSTAPFVQPTP